MPEPAAPAGPLAGRTAPHGKVAEPLPLCPSSALAERGLAFGFDVQLWGQSARAFALRFDGRVVAYMNRCAHVPVEMDWQAGDFLDHERRWIVCSIHGATYDPVHGHCLAGPCAKRRLMAIETVERDGQVCWYPSRDIQPAAASADPAHTPTGPTAPACTHEPPNT